MAVTIERIEYYYVAAEDKRGVGYWLLQHLKDKDVNLISFTAFPLGGGKSQLDFVPDDADKFKAAMAETGVDLVGPKRAFLVRGDDEVGAITELHHKLSKAMINVRAANGVTDGQGKFGYVLWVRSEDYEPAARALGVFS